MSGDRLPPELPERDPGLPRFVWLVYGGLLVLGLVLLLRPDDGLAVLAPEPEAERSVEGEDLAGRGARIFVAEGCSGCHATVGADGSLGPSLYGLAQRATTRLAAPDYQGRAVDAAGYVVEASLDHCLDPLPGWDCPDLSGLALRLSIEDGEALAAYLLDAAGSEPGVEGAP